MEKSFSTKGCAAEAQGRPAVFRCHGHMTTDTKLAGHRTRGGVLITERPAVVERALAVVMATPPVRTEAVDRGRSLLASEQWCRADEVAAELVRCYAGRLVP